VSFRVRKLALQGLETGERLVLKYKEHAILDSTHEPTVISKVISETILQIFKNLPSKIIWILESKLKI